MNFEVIDLEWEEPFKVTYDRDSDSYDLSAGKLLDKNGFYQIYGQHPVYGSDVLLYIGETKDNGCGRSFETRLLKEHMSGSNKTKMAGRFWYMTDLSIRIAPSNIAPEIIKVVESMLLGQRKSRVQLEVKQ